MSDKDPTSDDDLSSSRDEWQFTDAKNLRHTSGLLIECMPNDKTIRYSINAASVEQLKKWHPDAPYNDTQAWYEAMVLLQDAILIYMNEQTNKFYN